MPITSSLIYLAALCDGIKMVFCLGGIGLFVVAAILLISSILGEDENLLKRAKKPFFIGVILVLIGCFVPSKRDIVTMIVLPPIAQNEQIKSITNNSLPILEELTKEWLEELKSKKRHKSVTIGEDS